MRRKTKNTRRNGANTRSKAEVMRRKATRRQHKTENTRHNASVMRDNGARMRRKTKSTRRNAPRRRRKLAPTRSYATRLPGRTPASGAISASRPSASSANRNIPCDSMPLIVRGARLASTSTDRPTSAAGSG